MAGVIECDGCGTTTRDKAEFKPLGYLIERDYCPECYKTAEKYIAAADKLRDEVRKEFSERFKDLKTLYCVLNRLPDADG